MQLVFAKAHQKFTSRKSGRGPGLGGAPQNLGVRLNISATAEASDFIMDVKVLFKHPQKMKKMFLSQLMKAQEQLQMGIGRHNCDSVNIRLCQQRQCNLALYKKSDEPYRAHQNSTRHDLINCSAQ